jgi:hypothetical protein
MRWVYLLFLFLALGLVGAFPSLLLAYFLSAGQAQVAWHIYFIAAAILASYLPLKGLIDSRVKQQPLSIVFPKHINSLAISFAFVAFLFLIPFLYVSSFYVFIVGILAYILTSGSFAFALLIALLLQTSSLYLNARREKDLGIPNSVFQNFTVMGFGDDMIIDAERQTPQPYTSEMLILPPLDESAEDEESLGYYEDDREDTSSSES